MPESHPQKALPIEAGIQSTTAATDLTSTAPARANSQNILTPTSSSPTAPRTVAPSLEEVLATTLTAGNTLSPSATLTPAQAIISQLQPSIPTPTQTEPLAPVAAADNKPSSSSSQPTPPSPDKYAPTKPIHIPQTNNTHSSTIDSSNGHNHVNRPLPPTPALDWIVPYESKIHVKTVEERILPTIIAAEVERKKYSERAMMKGYTMNITIGIQLLVGALTTAISALVTGREITIVLPILGGISTLTAAFLTRARGSNEPERSLMVARDLEQFIRECKAFLVDFGSSTEDVHKREVQRLRNRFEEILRDADVEKK
ncbi:hypothetical protein EDD85DRAFT_88605 [Armillaria nabsnona]|nr:hypothetical protein EDD85DRAFT_88605 [Armillaria nabsnona]